MSGLEFAAALRAGGVQHLYHLTALANLRSIKEDGGICSAMTRHLSGREVPVLLSDERSRDCDWIRDNASFVSLSFSRCTPLRRVYKSRRPGAALVLLCLSLDVAGTADTVITSTNAGSRRAEPLLDPRQAVARLNVESFRWEPSLSDPRRNQWKHDVQAEVLVPDRVPLRFIEEIVIESEVQRRCVEAVFGDRFRISVAAYDQWCPQQPPPPLRPLEAPPV